MYYDEESRKFHLKLYLFLNNAKECGKECRLVEHYIYALQLHKC
jgi:hypothetical protein